MFDIIKMIKLGVMLVPAVIAGFLYYENHSLQKKLLEANITIASQKENIQILKKNVDTITSVNKDNQKTLAVITADNTKASKIIKELHAQSLSDANMIDYLVNKVTKDDDLPATKTLKEAVVATKGVRK